MLDTFDSMKKRIWCHCKAFYLRTKFLQSFRCTHECSRGSCTCRKVRNFSVCLSEDFLRRTIIMCLPILLIAVLIKVEILLGMLGNYSAEFIVCTVNALHRICLNDFRTVGLHNFFAFFRYIFRHCEPNSVTQRCSGHSVSDTRIAAGCINNNFFLCQSSAFMPSINIAFFRPVFH